MGGPGSGRRPGGGVKLTGKGKNKMAQIKREKAFKEKAAKSPAKYSKSLKKAGY